MQQIWDLLYSVLGLASEPKDLTFLQVSLRGVIVFVVTLIIVRFGDRRSLAQKSAFDLVLVVIISSVLARAVNGSGPFFGTLGGAFVIVLLHRGLARAVYQWPALGRLVKGRPVVLMRDGAYQQAAMRGQLICKEDIEEDMRLEAATEEKIKIKVARLEPSGDISFIKQEKSGD